MRTHILQKFQVEYDREVMRMRFSVVDVDKQLVKFPDIPETKVTQWMHVNIHGPIGL
jgi:hypothetical protein